MDDLARHLFALDCGSRSTGEVTTQITRAVVAWAVGLGWSVRTEARVAVEATPETSPQLGYVDVIVRPGGGQPDLAIEIDSADKPWSVVKLRHAVAAGMRAVWIRWGDEMWAGAFEDVDVIQLMTMRRPRSRDRPGQLDLWGS